MRHAVNSGRPTKSNKFVLYAASVAVLIVVAIIALGALELTLRWFFPQTVRAVGDSTPISMNDPLLGVVLKPGARASVAGPEYNATYVINSEGIRDETPHSRPKPAGVTRVLVVGDSFTFGIGNDYPNIWPVLVEKGLNGTGQRVELVKAGVPSYDTRTEYLLGRRLINRYQPDLILMAFLMNDLYTNLPSDWKPESDTAARKLMNPTQHSDMQIVAGLQRLFMQDDDLYIRLFMLTSRRQYYAARATPLVTRQMEITRKLIAECAEYFRSQGATFVVVSIPQLFEVLVKASDVQPKGLDVDWVNRDLAKLAFTSGFDFLPSSDAFAKAYRNKSKRLYYRLDGHLTNDGNRVLADYLLAKLSKILASRQMAQAPL